MSQSMPARDLGTDSVVGWTLLIGLVSSCAVMVVGLGLAASSHNVHHVEGLHQLPKQILRGRPGAILDAGIVMLMMTPLVGVVAALMQFVRRRDALFVGVSLTLLAALVAGFLVALR